MAWTRNLLCRIDDQDEDFSGYLDSKVVYELQDMVAEARLKVMALIRAAGVASVYAVSLGCLFAAKQFWIDQTPNPELGAFRLRVTAEAVLRTSPYIILTGMLFAFPAIPLAVWAVGSATWGSLRRYIYVFWLVLALYILVCENADGLILTSGAGLIAVWFVRNVGLRLRSKNSLCGQTSLQTAGFTQRLTVFAALAAVMSVLFLFLFYGSGSKRYVSEILAIYLIACICQGIKVFRLTEQAQSANREVKHI